MSAWGFEYAGRVLVVRMISTAEAAAGFQGSGSLRSSRKKKRRPPWAARLRTVLSQLGRFTANGAANLVASVVVEVAEIVLFAPMLFGVAQDLIFTAAARLPCTLLVANVTAAKAEIA